MNSAIRTGLLCLCLLSAAGCAKPNDDSTGAQPAPQNGVRMDAETQARMGVEVATVAASSAAQAVEGYARVMDVSPLAAIDSEVSAAQAAAAASQGEYRRLSALAAQDQAASARAVEAARAQASADTARANLAARRIGLEWGGALEQMSVGDRSRLLSDVAAGRAALLRIDAPEFNGAVSHVSVRPSEGAAPISVSVLGAAANADSRLQTAGVIGVVRGASARLLPAGRMLRAELETSAPQLGFTLPASALVRADNSVWAYVKTGEDIFERRDVSSGRATTDGWFVGGSFAPEEQIVVSGPTSLLAAENGPMEAE